MRVRFIRDFQGAATRELFYEAGTEVDLPDEVAVAVIGEGAAERIASPPEPKAPRGKKAADGD